MRLTSLRLANWLCHNHLEIEFAPLTLVTGPNAAGKSSIADAIAFALGELRRVPSAGHRGGLMTEGAPTGSVTLSIENWTTKRDIASGKAVNAGNPPALASVRDAVSYVLLPSRFSRASADERAVLLRRVMHVDLGPDALKTELNARGYDPALVATLKPIDTIDTWIAACERGATEARGAWKAITGQAYGSVKAETWQAPMPPHATNLELTAATTRITELEVQHVDLQRRIGAAKQAGPQAAELRRTASRMEDAQASVKRFSETLASLTAVKASRAARPFPQGTRNDSPPMCCPGCGNLLVVHEGMLMAAPHAPKLNPTQLAVAAAEESATLELAVQITEMESNLRTAQAAVGACAVAQAALELLGPETKEVPTASLADLELQANAMQQDLTLARNAERAARAGIEKANQAAQANAQAQGLHAMVKGWTLLAAALSPDGIPGELLRRCLAPFNAELASFAGRTGWPTVVVSDAMDLAVGNRPYALSSESEQWRADAMLAMALATKSGIKVVVLDRFDVLEPAARSGALKWLFGLTKGGQMDSIVLMATLKEPMKTVPPGAKAIWLGRTDQEEAEAA